MSEALAITDADTRYLCACGCGDEINSVVREIDTLIGRGLNHRQIALRLQVSRSYVSRMLNPRTRPRFVKGHTAHLAVWRDATCVCCGRTFRAAGKMDCCGSSDCQMYRFQRHLFGETTATRLRRERERVQAERQAERERVQAERNVLRNRQRLERLKQRRERKRIARLRAEAMQRVKAHRAEQRERNRAANAKAKRQDKLRRSLERADRASDGLLVYHQISLSAPIFANGGNWDEYVRSHDIRIGEDTATIVERQEVAATIQRIAGDIGPEDVLRMNESELDAIRRKLIEAGIGPGGVQESERERLREPATHSGRGINKAPLKPGRKTRRQKIAHKQANANAGNSNRPKQKPRKRWTRA